MQIDPRTVARDIPGVFYDVFPQLTAGIVGHFNSQATRLDVQPLSAALLAQSQLQRAMLFELGTAVGERLVTGTTIDWKQCSATALQRQRAYFDARLPEVFEETDKILATIVGQNLAAALRKMSSDAACPVGLHPRIPGLEWISNGYGDFAIGRTIVEVKCTAKRFSAADYRQVAIYWLLSYAAAVEGRGDEWTHFALLNPRRGDLVFMRFDAFLSTVSNGLTLVDILQLFQALVGSRRTQ